MWWVRSIGLTSALLFLVTIVCLGMFDEYIKFQDRNKITRSYDSDIVYGFLGITLALFTSSIIISLIAAIWTMP